MAIGVLILGESGTGKTHSIKGFDPSEVKILSVSKSILPFRGKYELVKTPTSEDVIRELNNTDKKNIIIDDFQYILGLPMMKRISEKGWDKFNEISQSYSNILQELDNLPNDVIVYFTSHVETDENGKVKIKTIGKALDKYITIEGLFMIVLGTQVLDQNYFFTTQNNGSNTIKTPEGMFEDLYIPNNLKYVADKIRNYYYMDGAKSDEEMKVDDAAFKVPEESTHKRRSRRSKRGEEALEFDPNDLPFEIITDDMDKPAFENYKSPFELSPSNRKAVPCGESNPEEDINNMNQMLNENKPYDPIGEDIQKKIEESGDTPKKRTRRVRNV